MLFKKVLRFVVVHDMTIAPPERCCQVGKRRVELRSRFYQNLVLTLTPHAIKYVSAKNTVDQSGQLRPSCPPMHFT